MVLKFIFVGIWKILKFLVIFMAENMNLIYMYMYFGYGFYLIYTKQEIDNSYLFLGLIVVATFLNHYIDKKFKPKN